MLTQAHGTITVDGLHLAAQGVPRRMAAPLPVRAALKDDPDGSRRQVARKGCRQALLSAGVAGKPVLVSRNIIDFSCRSLFAPSSSSRDVVADELVLDL